MVVADARPDVQIVVFEQGEEPIGFFPFQCSNPQRGEAVGLGISDMQGLVGSAEGRVDLRAMLDASGLKSWRFDHLIDGHGHFSPYRWVVERAPLIDISKGFESYRINRRRAGSQLLEQALRKERKLGSEKGEVRFEFHDTKAAVFDALLQWKSQKRRATRTRNVLKQQWVRTVLQRFAMLDSRDFGGVLSALYVGDELAAAHLGIRTATVLHWWFPTFNLEFASYSPGLVLLTALIRECAGRGIKRIDLGKGLEPYKCSLMTGTASVSEGAVARRESLTSTINSAWCKTRKGLRDSPLREPIARAKFFIRLWNA